MAEVLKQIYEVVDVDELKPHPKNPRKGDTNAITVSVEANGFYGAIVAQRSTGHILAGNHRWKAAKESALQQVPVVWVDVDDKTARRILLADNRTNDVAGYDEPALAKLLEEIRNEQDWTGTGYTEDDFDGLLKELGDETLGGNADPDNVPEPQLDKAEELRTKWGTELGQLWVIPSTNGGEHRILCGDSTKVSDVQRLVASEPCAAMWTDPPYGVSYVGKTKDALRIENDGESDVAGLLNGFLGAADGALSDGAPVYIAYPPGPIGVQFQNAALDSPWLKFHQTLVWVKQTFVLGHSDYHYRHEGIIYGWKGKNRTWYAGRDQDTVFEVDKPARNGEHPTMKPLALIVKSLQNSTKMGDHVFEPFSGSGSTMAACETTGRLCRAIELEPKYVAVALQRMADIGLEPRLAT